MYKDEIARKLRSLSYDLDDLADDMDPANAEIDSDSAQTILSLLKMLPRVIDHLEGYAAFTDRDMRILKEDFRRLEAFAAAYDITESPRVVAA